MQLSRVLRIIIKMPGRPPQWREMSETRLPPGYKIFDYSPKYYGSIILASGVCCYAYAQSCINPESKWAKACTEFFNMTSVLSSYFSPPEDETNVADAN
ncbi:hypothetical protein M3Y94_01108900 [Aphelenchoides besseyi]|nr:hypothetical protein M3Y94_01108900 [Aphelenchoides besseyi]KAI6221538.1 hypothetical protein M3Y95_00972400 [Aphelenchoides besseyi]